MAGKGPPPKPPGERRRANKPVSGEWKAAPGVGWQHGPIPEPPDGLLAETLTAWDTWFKAWFAAHWSPADVPALRMLIRLHDGVLRGDETRRAEWRLQLDTWGISPKGQQDRHWAPPKEDGQSGAGASSPSREGGGRYGHLRSIEGGSA